METKEKWEKIKDLFGAALERDPSDRDAFLQAACGTDVSLRQEVESLISADKSSSNLWQHPFRPQPSENAEGRFIGPYQLLKRIGEGGMGQVWLAEQTSPLQRRVALKLIRWGMYDDTLLHRFQAERQSLAVMDHPSIAKVFDAGATSEGQPYFVMEYVAGIPITDYCDQKKLKIRDRLELFIKVCEAVQHAHQKAIIHRDLKPANILVVEVDCKPVPRVIDFGLAKATNADGTGESLHPRAGSFVGTPGYMSPEQCDPAGQDVDTRTDVYSLGVVLYILLAGSLPFDAKEWKNKPFDEILRRIREQDPPSPSTRVSSDRDTSSATAQARGTEPKQLVSVLRGDLDWITMKAVERDRTRRYGTPSELAADIARYLRHEPVTARPASVSYRLQKYVRRHRVALAVAAMIVALLLAFGVMQGIQLRKITRERDRADRITDFMTGIFKVSDPYERVGDTVTAREILDKASKDIDTGLARDPELQARMMHVMGKAYSGLGLHQRAQWLLERSIKLDGSTVGQENRETLKASYDLAWTLFEQGHLAEAEALERNLMDVQRRVLGPEDLDTLNTMGNLAVTLCEEGKCKEAARLEQEVLQKKERMLGPEAFGTLATEDNLATMLELDGQLAEAEKVEQETLEIQLRVFGRENLGTISSMINMAGIERDMGRGEQALKLYRETLDLEEHVLGPDQPETAVTRHDLAALLAQRGQTDEALSLLRQAVDHGLQPRVDLEIEKDPLFNPLHSDPRFAALVAHAKQRSAAQISK